MKLIGLIKSLKLFRLINEVMRVNTCETLLELTKVIDALKILGLKEGASKDDIKSAYRKLAKEFHPDKLAGMSEGIIKLAKEKFQEIQSSYEYLNNNYV